MPFDRKRYFDAIRPSPFGGKMTQQQVDGQECILTQWESYCEPQDHRWLAYELATTFHETAATMAPVKEYGSQAYLQSKPYYPYVGRGYVQLTWDYNYDAMGQILGCNLLGNPDLALTDDTETTPVYIASTVMFEGMCRGTFRPPHKLSSYFNATKDDPVNARAIINNDVSKQGQKIAGYHKSFLAALEASYVQAPTPEPEPEPGPTPEARTFTWTVPADLTIVPGSEITITVTPPAAEGRGT